jgi:peptidoglycan hydrolase-like protein with peptidoglycan-binding domain
MMGFKSKCGTALLACLLGVAFTAMPTEAEARLHHHKSTHATQHKKAPKKAVRTGASLRTAQAQLADLGYYSGAVDGKNGPMTRKAISNFQRDHGLKMSGALDKATAKALAQAAYDVRGKGASNLGMGPVSALPPPLLDGPKGVTSRFSKVDIVVESPSVNSHNYQFVVNDQTIITAVDQPGPLKVSPTYALGDEDIVLVTVYTGNVSCLYETSLVSLRANGTARQNVSTCGNEYKAYPKSGSLYIEIPNGFDGRNTGVTWRYENGKLDQLL